MAENRHIFCGMGRFSCFVLASEKRLIISGLRCLAKGSMQPQCSQTDPARTRHPRDLSDEQQHVLLRFYAPRRGHILVPALVIFFRPLERNSTLERKILKKGKFELS
jgi:hypothetical protein